MSRPRLLDLYSCAGGAGMGYHLAGFEVVGVDIVPQKRYPFEHHVSDAIDFLRKHGDEFDAVHASPPCQRRTRAQTIRGNEHPALIGPTRDAIREIGVPYVIENVPTVGDDDDPLIDPFTLCGAMFPGLQVYRHREFETSFGVQVPPHPEHVVRQTKMGRTPVPGEFMHVVGNFTGVAEARVAMGIDWMSRDELREAIPPAYTEFIGCQLLAAIGDRSEAAA